MKRTELANLIRNTGCRVIGAEDASNDAQREVLAALIAGHNESDSTILCEPSLARKTTRPPDAVLVDLIAGVHVIEVKGIGRFAGRPRTRFVPQYLALIDTRGR